MAHVGGRGLAGARRPAVPRAVRLASRPEVGPRPQDADPDLHLLLGHRPRPGRGTRASGTAEMPILFCDLAGFKEFNNQAGQQLGDEVLRAFAAALGGIAWARPIRDGGDEFVVIGAPGHPGFVNDVNAFRAAWPGVFAAAFGHDVPAVRPASWSRPRPGVRSRRPASGWAGSWATSRRPIPSRGRRASSSRSPDARRPAPSRTPGTILPGGMDRVLR